MKKFKVFITEENGHTLHVDNGVVISNAARKPLPNNPDGWQDISIGWERNLTLYGVVRNFSLALGFVRDAAKILRKVFYIENIERRLSLLITMLNLTLTNTTYAFNYLFLYKGDLDLSTFTDQPNKVTMQIMEGGISKLLKANIDTVYEIPMKDTDAKSVYCDGIDLVQRVNYAVTDGLVYEGGTTPVMQHFVIDMPILSTEGRSAEFVNFSQVLEGVGVVTPGIDAYRHSSLNYFLQNSGDTELFATLKGRLYLRYNSGNVSNVYLTVISNVDGALISTYSILSPTIGQTYTIDLDLLTHFTGIVDQRYFFMLQMEDGASQPNFEFLPGSFLRSEFISRFRPTYVLMFTLADLFRKLTGRITGSEADAISTLLAANPNIMVTCGDAIRGFINADGDSTAVIKTKMSDCFKSANVQFNAGMGIELNKLTLEDKVHYFDSSNPIPLGEVKSLKTTLATDLMFNTLRIGSPPQDYNDINGRQEFNNETLFGSVITRIIKEFNLVSPYRRDSYGFEYTRINFDGKVTTDSDSDNDVWLVNVARDVTFGSVYLLPEGAFFDTVAPNLFKLPGDNLPVGTVLFYGVEYTVVSVDNSLPGFTLVTVLQTVTDGIHSGLGLSTNRLEPYALKRGTYDTIEGLISPDSVFNLEDMTIQRLIEKHGNWIHSMMWGFEDEVMEFLTTDKNRELKTVQGAVTYDEDTDIIIKDLALPLCIPVYFEIETKVPVNLPTLLENNPAKCFSFTWEGNLYKGFLMKAGISVSDNACQVFKLLSTPDNDLSKLVV